MLCVSGPTASPVARAAVAVGVPARASVEVNVTLDVPLVTITGLTGANLTVPSEVEDRLNVVSCAVLVVFPLASWTVMVKLVLDAPAVTATSRPTRSEVDEMRFRITRNQRRNRDRGFAINGRRGNPAMGTADASEDRSPPAAKSASWRGLVRALALDAVGRDPEEERERGSEDQQDPSGDGDDVHD